MDNKPASPFGNLNRLDTKLIRSTKRDSPPPPESEQPISDTTPTPPAPAPPHKPSVLSPTSLPSHSEPTEPSGRMAERPNGHHTIRHGFDIFADQMEALKDIQRAREKRLKRKVTLGQLVQEALECLIQRENPEHLT